MQTGSIYTSVITNTLVSRESPTINNTNKFYCVSYMWPSHSISCIHWEPTRGSSCVHTCVCVCVTILCACACACVCVCAGTPVIARMCTQCTESSRYCAAERLVSRYVVQIHTCVYVHIVLCVVKLHDGSPFLPALLLNSCFLCTCVYRYKTVDREGV